MFYDCLGEKLYEELITEGDGIVFTHHQKIMVLRGNGKTYTKISNHILTRKEKTKAFDGRGLRKYSNN